MPTSTVTAAESSSLLVSETVLEVTELPEDSSLEPPKYTLTTFTTIARTKNTIAAVVIALLSIASLVLPEFLPK